MFARIRRDETRLRPRRWPSLHCGLNALACGVSHTQTANLPSGCFLCEFELTDRFGDLRLYQEDLIAIWILKIKPLYA